MKKYIIVLIAVLSLVFSASAQTHTAQNLLAGAGTITLAASTTTNLPAAVSRGAGLWGNRDGTTANASLVLSMVGTNANATNTVAFTLQTVPDGSTTTTAAENRFTYTLTGNGTTAVTISTNLPSALLQGVKAIKITSIVTGSSAAGGGAVTITPKLVGFVP